MSEEKKKVVVKAVKPKKVSAKPVASQASNTKAEETKTVLTKPAEPQPSKSIFEEPQQPVKEPVPVISREPEPAPAPEKKKPAVYNQWWFWLILAAAILGLAALMTHGNNGGETNSTDTAGASNSAEAVEVTADNSDSISVDENLLTVEVTMPAAFFENETPEEIQASAKESGFISCTVNEDGSVTYKMTKGKREEILRSFKGEIDSTIQEFLAGGENAPKSYRKITYNDKVTQFDVRVDRAAYESSWTDALYMMSFYMFGGYYQIVDGVPNDQVDVIVNIIDDATGETIESGSYKNFIANTQA